jgi:RNA polymerase sporulation-specific sigma factor
VALAGSEPADAFDRVAAARARSGDEGAMATLLARYTPLLRGVARRYFLPCGDADDLVQEATIGLLKAVRDYRPETGVPFRPFAELCVTRQVITAVKAATRQKHIPLNAALSLSRPLHEDGGTLEEVLADGLAESPEERALRREDSLALARAVATLLSPYERRVVGLYLEGRSFGEIAAACGTHVKSVDNALWRVKAKLRRHFRRGPVPSGPDAPC